MNSILASKRLCPIMMFLMAAIFCLPFCAYAEMSAMSNEELSAIACHGFSEFSLTTDVNGLSTARVNLGIQADTYTTIDSLKMGYWDNTANTNGLGWDQNWSNVSVGSDSNDLQLNGFFFEATFTDIENSATRQLKSVTIGFTEVTGTLTGDFSSITLLSGSTARDSVGNATYTFNGDSLVLTINVDGDNAGVSFDFGNATVTANE